MGIPRGFGHGGRTAHGMIGKSITSQPRAAFRLAGCRFRPGQRNNLDDILQQNPNTFETNSAIHTADFSNSNRKLLTL